MINESSEKRCSRCNALMFNRKTKSGDQSWGCPLCFIDSSTCGGSALAVLSQSELNETIEIILGYTPEWIIEDEDEDSFDFWTKFPEEDDNDKSAAE